MGAQAHAVAMQDATSLAPVFAGLSLRDARCKMPILQTTWQLITKSGSVRHGDTVSWSAWQDRHQRNTRGC